ncbi:hypothetical protein FBU30_004198 [Linnemannia zychae]|nr:hypothetical protein FBU30_004198 [Linnemannia zychae]
MPLSQESITTVLAYLDPSLDTLETGFPTSTRPNESPLTKDQKRAKIESALQKDPAIFLSKWGSVILYPRPQTNIPSSDEPDKANGDLQRADSLTAAKNILDIFNPLAVDYEIRYHLTKLYQQLHQLIEHANFKASMSQQSGYQRTLNMLDKNSSTFITDSVRNRSHGYNPTIATNYMDIDSDLSSSQHTVGDNKDIPEEDRKPNPGQNDLFTRSTLSQNTRRNRRLNYLLRHLAPPDTSGFSSTTAGGASTNTGTGSSTSRGNSYSAAISSSSTAGVNQSKSNRDVRNPTLANILSISGSMANLSFSESTYFSDAEMEARAPELYQQYIGRFMDRDDGDSQGEDDIDDGQGEATGAEDADDEREDNDARQSSGSPEPFSKDIGLVDRILWNIDHPTLKQLRRQRQQGLENRRAAQNPALRQQNNSTAPYSQQTTVMAAPVIQKESESEFEEEFDTESENDDAEMELPDQTQGKQPDQNTDPEKYDRKGPLKNIADDDLLAKTSVIPPIPPSPIPGVISSTFASAAMTLEQPESRARFAELERGNGMGSSDDESPKLDQATKEKKEDQEALRQEFVLLMKQRFLDGLDSQFDYSLVDFDENLDDLEQEDYDVEDRYFDAEDEDDDDKDLDDDKGGHLSPIKTGKSRSMLPMHMNYDERIQAWENSAQNGAGDYDY